MYGPDSDNIGVKVLRSVAGRVEVEHTWRMEENWRGCNSGMVLETLTQRGWCLEDTDQLKAIIHIQSALADEHSQFLRCVESELLNSDLRSIGAKSLPQPSLLRNASSLHGPKVLQAISSPSVY